MKKVNRPLVLVLCLSIIMASFALALSTVTYTLDDLFMQVSIPAELAVFTRNIPDNDPNLVAFGLNKQSLEELYRTNNVYLNAIAMDNSYELVIIMNKSDYLQKVFDLNLYDYDAIKEIEESTKSSCASAGNNITNFSIYNSDTAKFFIIDYYRSTDGILVYSRRFYTVYNGQAISIVLNALAEETTSTLEDELQSVVDSAVFFKTLPVPDNAYASEGNKSNTILDNAATGYMVGGISAAIFAAVYAVINAIKKKKSKVHRP